MNRKKENDGRTKSRVATRAALQVPYILNSIFLQLHTFDEKNKTTTTTTKNKEERRSVYRHSNVNIIEVKLGANVACIDMKKSGK